MMFKAVILTALVAATNAQCPAVPEGGCNICGGEGEGLMCVTQPDAVFVFPSQPTTPCGILQQAGYDGMIPLAQCPFLVPFVGICECGIIEPTPAPVAPTPAPVAPTPAPVDEPPAGGCPSVPDDGCSICGPDQCVTNPDAIFVFPDQPSTPCGILQMAGLNGDIPLDQCGFLPPFVGICECAALVSMPPVEPTAMPVEPTPMPVEPTDPPVAPTPAPVAPTDMPIEAQPVLPTPFPIFILTPQPTPTDELPPPVDEGKMGMGMGSTKTSMGMGMGSGDSGGMGMAMKRRLDNVGGGVRSATTTTRGE